MTIPSLEKQVSRYFLSPQSLLAYGLMKGDKERTFVGVTIPRPTGFRNLEQRNRDIQEKTEQGVPIETIAAAERLSISEFLDIANKKGVSFIGELPREIKETIKQGLLTPNCLDELAQFLRKKMSHIASLSPKQKTSALKGVFFNISEELNAQFAPLLVSPLGGGADGNAYLIEIHDKNYAFKIFDMSNPQRKKYATNSLLMGAHYLASQPFKDNNSFHCGSLNGNWSLEEYIKEDCEAERKGSSWTQYIKRFGISPGYDHSVNIIWSSGLNVRIDRDMQSFSLENIPYIEGGIHSFEEFLYYFNHPDPLVRKQSVLVIDRLSEEAFVDAMKLLLISPDSRELTIKLLKEEELQLTNEQKQEILSSIKEPLLINELNNLWKN
ncbi:MAG: hypothetical protein ACK481_06775 [Candidatus Melainabacteria bacterium]